jgi:hypothetical protein
VSCAFAVVKKIGDREQKVLVYALSPAANATPPQTMNACFKVAVIEA